MRVKVGACPDSLPRGAVDVMLVELSLAGSAGGVELVDQAFQRPHAHMVLIRAEHERSCGVRGVGLDVGLGFDDG